MTVFEDIKGSFDSVLSGGQGAEGLSSDAQFLIIAFAIILAAVLILLLVVALRYKSQSKRTTSGRCRRAAAAKT